MKTEIKLTLAALLFPLATTACAMQPGTEDVSTTDQDITETTPARPQLGDRDKMLPRQDLARQFTATTVLNQPAREMSNDPDPTSSKKVYCTDPVPVPWDPAKSGH